MIPYPGMSEKEEYLKIWEREFQTTLKVLKAFPPKKLDFKPHERSRSAAELAWTFVNEESVTESILKGKVEFPDSKPPGSMDAILKTYEKTHKAMVAKVKAMPDAEMDKPIPFPVAPKKMAEIRRADILWMMMMDAVHHRGQFSVYIRMAGGKVPSIYGPSADEPWF